VFFLLCSFCGIVNLLQQPYLYLRFFVFHNTVVLRLYFVLLRAPVGGGARPNDSYSLPLHSFLPLHSCPHVL